MLQNKKMMNKKMNKKDFSFFSKLNIFSKFLLITFAFTVLPVTVAGIIISISHQEFVNNLLNSSINQDNIFLVLENIRIQTLTVLLIIAVLSLFGTIFAARNLVQPLKKIIKGIDRASKYDFTYKLEVETKDEMGSLMEKFNEMTKKLEDELFLERKLQELNKNLENKIKELEKFKKITTGRELKMIELKKELSKTKKELENIKNKES